MASMSHLTMAMVTLYSGDRKRIQHFMKVYAFAKMIAEEEQLGAKQREIVEAAALVHDIGIHAAEKKYRSAAGEYQEIEGPPIARAMLMALETDTVDFICTDMPTAMGAVSAYPDMKILDFSGSDDNFQVDEGDINIGISVMKGNTELKDAIDSVLSTMTADDFNAMMDEAIAIQPLNQ